MEGRIKSPPPLRPETFEFYPPDVFDALNTDDKGFDAVWQHFGFRKKEGKWLMNLSQDPLEQHIRVLNAVKSTENLLQRPAFDKVLKGKDIYLRAVKFPDSPLVRFYLTNQPYKKWNEETYKKLFYQASDPAWRLLPHTGTLLKFATERTGPKAEHLEKINKAFSDEHGITRFSESSVVNTRQAYQWSEYSKHPKPTAAGTDGTTASWEGDVDAKDIPDVASFRGFFSSGHGVMGSSTLR